MPLFLFLQSFHHASSNMCRRIVFCESSVRCWWSYPSECGHVLWFRGVRGVYVSRRFARVLISTHLVHRLWYVFSHGFQRRHGSEPLGGFGGVRRLRFKGSPAFLRLCIRRITAISQSQ